MRSELLLALSNTVTLNQRQSYPQKTFGNIWKHFDCQNLGEGCSKYLVGSNARDAAKYPVVCTAQPPAIKLSKQILKIIKKKKKKLSVYNLPRTTQQVKCQICESVLFCHIVLHFERYHKQWVQQEQNTKVIEQSKCVHAGTHAMVVWYQK